MAVIFIVEDEEGIRTELKTLLERNGYECLVATDFQTILQQIETVKPHLVLLDINLPVYDGFYLPYAGACQKPCGVRGPGGGPDQK